MQNIKTQLDLAGIANEVLVLPFWVDGSQALMAVKPDGGLPIQSPLVQAALQELARLRNTPALHIMVNLLPPGVVVGTHRDWLLPTKHQPQTPTLERWHLPLTTNHQATFWDEDNGETHMDLGFWWGPVPYWLKHSVRNLGGGDRLHLVVDLDTPVPLGAYRE